MQSLTYAGHAHDEDSRIPHYYAEEATDAIKSLLGDQYHVDRQPYWSALWDTFIQCQWVEPDTGKTKSWVCFLP